MENSVNLIFSGQLGEQRRDLVYLGTCHAEMNDRVGVVVLREPKYSRC